MLPPSGEPCRTDDFQDPSLIRNPTSTIWKMDKKQEESQESPSSAKVTARRYILKLLCFIQRSIRTLFIAHLRHNSNNLGFQVL